MFYGLFTLIYFMNLRHLFYKIVTGRIILFLNNHLSVITKASYFIFMKLSIIKVNFGCFYIFSRVVFSAVYKFIYI